MFHENFFIKIENLWAREMVQRLRALAALPEVPSSIPATIWWLTVTIRSGALFGRAGIHVGKTLYTQ